MNGREKKAKAAKDPIQNPQYIYQYKIQNIVPNTFSNKESIAQEESLHNQLKKINQYPSTVEGGEGGGGEGLLISSQHYYWKKLKQIAPSKVSGATHEQEGYETYG